MNAPVTIRLSSDRVECVSLQGQVLATEPVDDQGQGLAEAVRQSTLRAGWAPRSRVRTVLVGPWVQCRRVRGLPPCSGDELHRIVRTGRARFFRGATEELETAAGWEARDSAGTTVAVAAAVSQRTLREIEEAVGGASLRLVEVAPEAESFAGLRLVSEGQRSRRGRRAGALAAGLLLAAALAWVGVGLLGLLRLSRLETQLRQELQALRVPLAAVLAARNDLRDLTDAANALSMPVGERLDAYTLVAATARALPFGGRVERLLVTEEGRVELAGSLPQPGAFLERLLADSRLQGYTVALPAGRLPIPASGHLNVRLTLQPPAVP